MRVQSPLTNITAVLKLIKDSASRYQSTLNKNEAATRAVLIDPVLDALGWKIAHTSMVEVERTYLQTRVDYALLNNNGEVKAIVEAKQLGTDLSHPDIIKALMNYVYTYKMDNIFLTDGLVWQHFTNMQPTNPAPTKVLHLVNDDPVECAAYLVQQLDAARFWPEGQTIDVLTQDVTQLQSDLKTLQKEIAQMRASMMSGQLPPVIHIPQPPTNQIFVDLESIPNVSKTRPSLLRLPDGQVVDVKTWKDVLRECSKFALTSNPAIPVPFLDRAKRKVNLLDTAKPPVGISYVAEPYGGQQIYIYLNYDANNHVANAMHILKQVPVGSRKVKAAVVYS